MIFKHHEFPRVANFNPQSELRPEEAIPGMFTEAAPVTQMPVKAPPGEVVK